MTDRLPTLEERLKTEPADKVLRDGMQHSLNRAPIALNGCCCETANEITPSRRIPWGIIITAIIGIGFSLALWGWANRAKASERATPGPHEITLLFAGKDLDTVSRSFFTLSGPYEDYDACTRAKRRLVVMVKGATLRCDPVSPWRVR